MLEHRLTIHKSPLDRPGIALSVIVVDWGCHTNRVLQWLARQTLPRSAYEVIWVDLYHRASPHAMLHADWVVTCGHDGAPHKHKGYNVGLLLAAGEAITVCDADAIVAPDFLEGIVARLRPSHGASARVLTHRELRTNAPCPHALGSIDDLASFTWQERGDAAIACVSMARSEAIRVGGFDEHASFAAQQADAGELVRRLADDGVPTERDERAAVWRFVAPSASGVMELPRSLSLDTPTYRPQGQRPMQEGAAITALRATARPAVAHAFAPVSQARSLAMPVHPPRPVATAAAVPAGDVLGRFHAAVQALGASPTHAPVPSAAVPLPAATPLPAKAAPAVQVSDLDWRDIPVFIVNRNRHAALRRLVDWLLAAGTRRVVILDNASTYPPLLQYYDALPAGAKLLRNEQNLGPYAFWQQGVHAVIDTPYVVTDADVLPCDFCPADLIGRLLDTLRRYPDASKVGPALRIDDIPDGYVEADTVRKWESQFWEHPVAPGVFAAPIDTTFALYPARAEFSNDERALRLGYPCLAEHTPWYAEEHALDDEERYYRAHTSATFSNWSVAQKDSWVRRSERVRSYGERARVLHFDGGMDYIPGWINVGPQGRQVDIPFDPALNGGACTLPLADGSVDGIHLSQMLDQVQDARGFFDELYRVAKPRAKLQLRVPHASSAQAWQDGAQRRGWHEGAFAFLGQPALPAVNDGYGGDWAVEDVRLVCEGEAGAAPQAIDEMIVTLRAVKPARPRMGAAGAPPVPQVVSDRRADPAFARV